MNVTLNGMINSSNGGVQGFPLCGGALDSASIELTFYDAEKNEVSLS
jgi:hypothetical protein